MYSKVFFGILISILIFSVTSTSTEGEDSSYETQDSTNVASSNSETVSQISSTEETYFNNDAQEGSEFEGSQYDETEDENAQVIFGMRDQIERVIKKFSPYFYFSNDERYFTSRAEDIVDWSKITWDQVQNDKYVVQFAGPKAGQPFNSAAPVYVNVRYYGKAGRGGDEDEIWLTYVHSYNYNDCGPAVKITGKTFRKSVSTSVTACPIGLHHGDNEHVTVAISKRNVDKIRAIYFSQHSGGVWMNRDDGKLQWDGDHVRVFVSKGSHANYPSPGKNVYMTLMDKKSWAVDLKVELVDTSAESAARAIKWTPQTRWLAVNGKPFNRLGMSEAEKKFASLESRFGSQIINPKTATIIDTIMTITKPLRILSSSVDKSVKKAVSDIESELNPTSSCGLGGKPWWGDDDRKEP